MRNLALKIGAPLSAALLMAGVMTSSATAAPPAPVPGHETKTCINTYDCQVDFIWPQDSAGNPMPIAFDADANNGVEQPVAVSVDFTSNPHCGVTIGVAQAAGSWICPVEANMGGGKYRLYVYAGNQHDYSIGVRWG